MDFFAYLKKLLAQYEYIYCAYEAGCGGFSLCRQIQETGAQCIVVAPECLDAKNKTDTIDSRILANRLHAYILGNADVMTPCRIPTLEEEQRRQTPRLRKQLQKLRQQADKMGKSACLLEGVHVTGQWWSLKNWPLVKEALSAHLQEHMEHYRVVILKIQEQEAALDKQLEERIQLPSWSFKGLGIKLWSAISSEVMDFTRFQNRRQVSGFTGLCPGVTESRGKGRQLSITKQGNRRLRQNLVELAWLVIRYQPTYIRVLHKGKLFKDKSRGKRAARKKAVVGLARQLAIDLWRLDTGQSTPEQLGLITHASELKMG